MDGLIPKLDNLTLCTTYIAGIDEYCTALGWTWYLFIIVGCMICILLYMLFIQQTVSAIQYAHVFFRNSLIWTASVYPFMTMMTIIGFAIPRAQQVCYTVKLLYMTVAISKFADLTLLMYGSEQVMLWTVRKSEVKVNVGPLFCCCWFIPPIRHLTKNKLRMIIAGISQLPFTQSFYLVMLMILQAANQVTIGSLDPRGTYLWLNLFSVTTSFFGVYCLNILSELSQEHLKRYSYNKLSFIMKALIIVTKLQNLIFSIMAYYEIFPCNPPISHYVYRQTVENYFYLAEMLIFGVYSYLVYRKVDFSCANPTVVRTDRSGNLWPHHTAYLPSLSGQVENFRNSPPVSDFLDNTSSLDERGFDNTADVYPSNEQRNIYDFSRATLVIESAGESAT